MSGAAEGVWLDTRSIHHRRRLCRFRDSIQLARDSDAIAAKCREALSLGNDR